MTLVGMRNDDKVPAHVRYELLLRARKREAPSFFNSPVGRRTLFYGLLLAFAVFASLGGANLGDRAARAVRKGKVPTLHPADAAPPAPLPLAVPQSRPTIKNPPKMVVPYSVRDGMRAAVDFVRERQDFACEPVLRYLTDTSTTRPGEISAKDSTPNAIELPYPEVIAQPDAFRGAYFKTTGRLLSESLFKWAWKDPNGEERDLMFGVLVTDADATGIQFLSLEPIPQYDPKYASKWVAEGIFVQMIRQEVKGGLVRDIPLLVLTNSRAAPAGEAAGDANEGGTSSPRVGNLQMLPMRTVESPLGYLNRLGIVAAMGAVLIGIIILWRKRLSASPSPKATRPTSSKKQD